MYFDMSKNKVVRAFRDGTLEEAKTEEGPDGFLRGVLEDGQIFTNKYQMFPGDCPAGRL